MTQDTGSLFYCIWGVFYSSESEKKKKKKKSVNAAFPPSPTFSTLQVWGEENLRDKKKKKKKGDQLNISTLVTADSFVPQLFYP